MNPVVVATYGTRAEAELAAGLLRSEGIECTVSADDAGGAYGGMVLSTGARVLVPPGDASRAAELLGNAEGNGGTR